MVRKQRRVRAAANNTHPTNHGDGERIQKADTEQKNGSEQTKKHILVAKTSSKQEANELARKSPKSTKDYSQFSSKVSGQTQAPTKREKRPAQPSNNDNNNNNNKNHNDSNRPTKRKRTTTTTGRPSEQALQLSEQLKELSRHKHLDQALLLYRDPKNKSIRDGHHACIMIDCCARCGRIQEGEVIYQELCKTGKHVSVETKTALIKGYAHSGNMAKADALFESMCGVVEGVGKGTVTKQHQQRKKDRPNTRTLNTLLRGCLWSAAHVDTEGIVTGGVVTAEKAWKLCQDMPQNGGETETTSIFDVSSYEYSIALLCQALQTDVAMTRIQEMKDVFHVPSTTLSSSNAAEISQSVSESLALSYLALARAFVTLGQGKDALEAARQSLQYTKASKEALRAEKSSSSSSHSKTFSTKTKLATKQGKADPYQDGGRREESNALYRSHRLNEVDREATVIVDLCSNGISQIPRQMARRLVTRLLIVSGGGTTDAQPIPGTTTDNPIYSSRPIQEQFLNTLYFSYGLGEILRQLNIPIGDDKNNKFWKRRDCNRILGSIGLQGGIVARDNNEKASLLDLKHIFRTGLEDGKSNSNSNNNNKISVKKLYMSAVENGIEIELGSGYGDWIVQKAQQNPDKVYLSIELRSDRVGQTFSRTALLAAAAAAATEDTDNTPTTASSSSPPLPVNNLCMVGAESQSFLSNHLNEECASMIYINHPEPPTQTSFGSGDDDGLESIMNGIGPEPAHMLSSVMLTTAAKCLKTKGKIVIVTDNKWYGRLICATFVKVMRQQQQQQQQPPTNLLLLQPVQLKDPSYETIERFPINAGNKKQILSLYEGQPNETIGHSEPNSSTSTGSTYFDRLWRTGAGSHAERSSRFIIVLERNEN